MARASTATKLPLATWAKILGMHPTHFCQVVLGTPSAPTCNEVYFQYEWQNSDHVSREEIARAIAEAEHNVESALGYRLCPSWEVDEWQPTTRPFRPEFLNYGMADPRGYGQTVRANWGYFVSGGIKAMTLIDDAVAITYSDVDGDGYKETATVVVVTTAVDPYEIALIYPGKSGDEVYEIRPTTVAISGGSATIRFRRELAVREALYEDFDVQDGGAVLGTDDANFLTTVDVYRRYNDPQTQVSFLWEPRGCLPCGGSGCPSCSYSAQTGCLYLRGDSRLSNLVYSPASWDSTNLEFDAESWAVYRQPDIARLYYYAGWRNKSLALPNSLSSEWQRTIAYYAAALLDRPTCDCSADQWAYWRQDLTAYAGGEDGPAFFRDPSGSLDNPFGTRRGMVNAWRRVLRSSPIAKPAPLT